MMNSFEANDKPNINGKVTKEMKDNNLRNTRVCRLSSFCDICVINGCIKLLLILEMKVCPIKFHLLARLNCPTVAVGKNLPKILVKKLLFTLMTTIVIKSLLLYPNMD